MMFEIAVYLFILAGIFGILTIVAESDLVGGILAFFDEDGEFDEMR